MDGSAFTDRAGSCAERNHRAPRRVSRVEGTTMERRLAIVLAALLGSFSLLWIINFKVVAIDHVLMVLR